MGIQNMRLLKWLVEVGTNHLAPLCGPFDASPVPAFVLESSAAVHGTDGLDLLQRAYSMSSTDTSTVINIISID
jgi:hypothetical protein